MKDRFPSGSGFDNGTKFDVHGSDNNRLRFHVDFHHMDEYGGYDGWTHHDVYVWADLSYGYRLTINGRNRNDIKGYIAEHMAYVLDMDEDFKFTVSD